MSLSYRSDLTERVIGLAIEVHRHLGPGLLESAYEECLCAELADAGVDFRRQVALPVVYKNMRLRGLQVGLLMNFNVVMLRQGLRRFVMDHPALRDLRASVV